MTWFTRMRHAALIFAADAVDIPGCALARTRARAVGIALMGGAEYLNGRANDVEFAVSGFKSRQKWIDSLRAPGGE